MFLALKNIQNQRYLHAVSLCLAFTLVVGNFRSLCTSVLCHLWSVVVCTHSGYRVSVPLPCRVNKATECVKNSVELEVVASFVKR